MRKTAEPPTENTVNDVLHPSFSESFERPFVPLDDHIKQPELPAYSGFASPLKVPEAPKTDRSSLIKLQIEPKQVVAQTPAERP